MRARSACDLPGWGGSRAHAHLLLLVRACSYDDDDALSAADRRALREALAALPEQLPYVRSYRLGGDIKLPECPQNADFTIVAEFDSPDDYLKYAAAPEHLAAVAMLKPFLAGRTAVQSYAVEYCVFAQARRVLSDNVLRLQLAAALCGAAAGFALARRRYR